MDFFFPYTSDFISLYSFPVSEGDFATKTKFIIRNEVICDLLDGKYRNK